MSYTTVDLVRHHVASAFPVQDRIVDQPVIVPESEAVALFSGAIEDTSTRVKSVQSHALQRVTRELGAAGAAITAAPIIRGSVVVAADSSLGMLFTENVDYIIDYETGDLLLKADGALNMGMSVVIWFQEYTLYEKGRDYRLIWTRGELQRLSGGSIAPGETVVVDYTPVYRTHTDEVLHQAVLEANHLIEREIDPDRIFGADPLLQTVATYRAVSIICRVSAARDLSALRGEDKSALAWLKLADMFADQAARLLAAFRPPYDNPAGPSHT